MRNVVDKFFEDSWKEYHRSKDYEVYIKDDILHLNIDLAGRKKEDFEITLEDDIINIKVNWNEENQKDIKWIIKNIREATTYSYNVPFAINGDKITASYEAGVLKIKAPKIKEIKPKRIKIE